jgi:hypothetical protein
MTDHGKTGSASKRAVMADAPDSARESHPTRPRRIGLGTLALLFFVIHATFHPTRGRPYDILWNCTLSNAPPDADGDLVPAYRPPDQGHLTGAGGLTSGQRTADSASPTPSPQPGRGKNWLKMYDKSGLVLQVETVINNPEEFRVRKQVLRKGKPQTEWVAMRKEVSLTYSAIVRSRSKPTAVISMPWQWSTIPPTRNGTSTASPPPKRMRQAVAAPVSIRSHDTTLNYSKASWPVTTACEASRIATSGHGSHQRVISGPSGTIP